MLNVRVTTSRYMSLGQAATYLGISKDWLLRMSNDGRIPARRVGIRRVFDIQELDAWMKAQKVWTEKK
jgi:excisionase family DNA binding protein